MGLLPDLLPGYTPVGPIDTQDPASRIALEYHSPTSPGLDLLQIFDAAAGANSQRSTSPGQPRCALRSRSATLKDTFVVVQEMFLTETAALADVVLPAANLYEKSGCVTNSYGDLQQVKKAADRAGVRTDFEMIVRIADKMARTYASWSRLGLPPTAQEPAPTWADARRGVGRGRSPCVWLTANNLEPRLSPFDPSAMLDEIQRLVPGYKLLRLQLLSGNDQHLSPAAAPSATKRACADRHRRDLVLPANDTLFTSGSLGRYSATLNDLQQNQPRQPLSRSTTRQ